MLRFVILGFLTYGQYTGYDLKQMMTYSTSNFMSAGFGGIYPALRKLEKDGLISSAQVIENGRNKKIYTINEMGKEEFMGWLEEPINFMRSYEDILAKVFFYEKLPKEKTIELIKKLIHDIEEKLKELKKIEPMVKKGTEQFQISTLYFGIDHLRFMIDWYEKFIEDLEKQ